MQAEEPCTEEKEAQAESKQNNRLRKGARHSRNCETIMFRSIACRARLMLQGHSPFTTQIPAMPAFASSSILY